MMKDFRTTLFAIYSHLPAVLVEIPIYLDHCGWRLAFLPGKAPSPRTRTTNEAAYALNINE